MYTSDIVVPTLLGYSFLMIVGAPAIVIGFFLKEKYPNINTYLCYFIGFFISGMTISISYGLGQMFFRI